MGRLAEAKEAGIRAVLGVCYKQSPRWILVAVSLKEKAPLDTIRLLTALERDFNLQLQSLEGIPEYADFVKSQEYRDWMKSRAAK